MSVAVVSQGLYLYLPVTRKYHVSKKPVQKLAKYDNDSFTTQAEQNNTSRNKMNQIRFRY